ncbi:MAG: hypothetical protein ABI995_04935 [Acidobacteriota bacterium]
MREGVLTHYRAAGLVQPHWQLRSWQWQAFFAQPQVQVPAQAPSQLHLVVLVVGFFTVDIVFLLLFGALLALSKGLTDGSGKHYSAC